MKNRWVALGIIFLSFLQFTFNWFDIVPCFGPIIGEMNIGLPQIGAIVGMFLLGYGLAHIPGGFLNEQIGMKAAMLAGIAIETLGVAVTGLAHNLDVLLLGRLLCGIGGSIYIGSAIGVITAWFREKELVTATGMITGVAFTLGAALGILPWHIVVDEIGWRNANIIGAGIGAASFILIVVAFPVPPASSGNVKEGHHLDIASLKRVFANRNLWLIGLSNLGMYGAYLTAVQLLPNFVEKNLGLSAGQAAGVGTIILLSGIPGSFIGGWLADKVFGVIPTFIGACIIGSVAAISIPFLNAIELNIAAALIGGATTLGFVGWISLPGLYVSELEISDIPTAVGLMLSIVAIGGVTVPTLYGYIAVAFGYHVAWVLIGVLILVTASVGLMVRAPTAGGRQLNLSHNRRLTRLLK